jgi:hypothetical protein
LECSAIEEEKEAEAEEEKAETCPRKPPIIMSEMPNLIFVMVFIFSSNKLTKSD